MKVLTEIHRREGITIGGRTVHRTAVRAIVLHGRALLMVYSANVGDYKFPGGGLEEGESHEQALHREIQEECGTTLVEICSEIGAIVEYDIADAQEYDLFKMTSYYYQGEVHGDFGAQKLDGYEQRLGFIPVWIDINQAIEENKRLLQSNSPPEWLRREIFMLEYLKQNVLKS